METRLICRNDAKQEYFSRALFPCVRKRDGKEDTGTIYQVYYSSFPMPEKKYKKFPLGRDGYWNIQEEFHKDLETIKSVIAAMQTASAMSYCYLSTDFSPQATLRGCSLGLAVAACVFGLPGNFAYTGWVSSYGAEPGKMVVGPVQGTETKIKFCLQHGIPLFVAQRDLENDDSTKTKSAFNRYYSMQNYISGIPFSPKIFEAIEAADFSEVMIMATAIYKQCETRCLKKYRKEKT